MPLLATHTPVLVASNSSSSGTGWTSDPNVLGYVEQSDEPTRFGVVHADVGEANDLVQVIGGALTPGSPSCPND